MEKTNVRYTFPKSERLCSRKLIDALYDQGSVLSVAPFRLSWMITELPADVPAQVVIGVSKRRFRHAVLRNRLKRQIREVYRHHKQVLFDALRNEEKKIAMMLIYTGKADAAYVDLDQKMQELMQRLIGLMTKK